MSIRILVTAPAVIEVDTPTELTSVLGILRHARVVVSQRPAAPVPQSAVAETRRPPVVKVDGPRPFDLEVLGRLRDGGAASTGVLAAALSVSSPGVRSALRRLEAAGRVRSEGRTHNQRWVAVEKEVS